MAEALNSVKSLSGKRATKCYEEINVDVMRNESYEGWAEHVGVRGKKVVKGQVSSSKLALLCSRHIEETALWREMRRAMALFYPKLFNKKVIA